MPHPRYHETAFFIVLFEVQSTSFMNTFKGYLYGCISSATYGLVPLFTLPLMSRGVHYDSILFYRYLFATLLLAIVLKFSRKSFRVELEDIPVLIMMGSLFALSSLFLFMSYEYMESGIASTILFFYPVLVTLIMAIFFKEKITWITISSIMLAFVGIGLLYKGGKNSSLSMIGICIVLLSALAYALYLVGVNKTRISNMDADKLTFYALLVGCGLFFVKLRFGMDLEMLPSLYAWGDVLLLALIPTVISCVTMVWAVHNVGSTVTAILGALEPVTAVFVGIVVFNEPITLNMAVGIFLIVLAVTIIILGRSLHLSDNLFKTLFRKTPKK